MNYTGIAAGIAVGLCGAAFSSAALADGSLSGRVGVAGGTYDFKAKSTCGGTPCGDDKDTDSVYGLSLGGRLGIKRVFVDLGIEALTFAESQKSSSNEARYRTDTNLSVGTYLGDRWNVFGGYRYATFGSSVFSASTNSNSGNTETGPFLGVGVQFLPGERFSISPSLAYNWLSYKPEGSTKVQDFKLNGLSLRVALGIRQTPHSVFLKWQRFAGDYTPSGFEYKYTENYFTVGYQAAFAKTW